MSTLVAFRELMRGSGIAMGQPRLGRKAAVGVSVALLTIHGLNPVRAADLKPVTTRAVGANRALDCPDYAKLL